MRYCDWDEVLDRDGLLILTEEALTPPRRSRAPLRRLAAAAACAGLVLGLMNYRAVAAGVGELCRYFAGIGATADDKAELWVLEEPVTWTEGDWTYEADLATLRSETLELELTMSSRLPADQFALSGGAAAGPVGGRGAAAQCRPHHHSPTAWRMPGRGAATPATAWSRAIETTASPTPSLYDGRPPPEDCALHVQRSGRQGEVFSHSAGCSSRDAPTVQKTWTLPQGG
ncbi:MAG: hypothetical protein ACLRWQ_14770 [Flavonifractor plautii]